MFIMDQNLNIFNYNIQFFFEIFIKRSLTHHENYKIHQ